MALSGGKYFDRRRFLRQLGAVAAAGGGAAAYSRWFESQALQVHTVQAPVQNVPAGAPLRIVHLSDLHVSEVVPLDYIDEAITLALAQKPDLVALTGDFYTSRALEPERYAKSLRRLSATAPTFACLGNHDGGLWARRAGGIGTPSAVVSLLTAAQIPCLLNTAETVTLRSRPVQVIGMGDLWSGMCDPKTAFQRTPSRAGAIRVVLNHNPDAKSLLQAYDWDLMLCGHTHGGQLRLPLLGAPLAPVNDKRYVEGLHAWENRWLYITRGVGNLHGVRFNCRPQVSVIDVV